MLSIFLVPFMTESRVAQPEFATMHCEFKVLRSPQEKRECNLEAGEKSPIEDSCHQSLPPIWSRVAVS